MARALSMDLRERVIAAIQSGEKQYLIAKRYNITQKTVSAWIVRYRFEGHIRPKIAQHKGRTSCVSNMQDLKTYIEKNCEKTAKEMALEYGITRPTLCRLLKKLGFVRKKKVTAIKSVVKKNEKIMRTYCYLLIKNN